LLLAEIKNASSKTATSQGKIGLLSCCSIEQLTAALVVVVVVFVVVVVVVGQRSCVSGLA
uniref:Surfactant protein C n=1 Tax=Brugia timori TaxID=42155 RepID=A0A0R3Q7X5_9BILA